MTKLYRVIVMTKLPPASKQTTSNCNRIFETQLLASVGSGLSTRKLIQISSEAHRYQGRIHHHWHDVLPILRAIPRPLGILGTKLHDGRRAPSLPHITHQTFKPTHFQHQTSARKHQRSLDIIADLELFISAFLPWSTG